MARYDAHVQAHRLAEKIDREVRRAAGMGLQAAIRFLTSRVKETLSVPAPRRKLTASNGDIYYVAKITQRQQGLPRGAPPRKLSARLRSSMTSEMVSPLEAVLGSNARADGPGRFNYPRYHEVVDPTKPGSGKHQYIRPTYERYEREIDSIIGEPVAAVFG